MRLLFINPNSTEAMTAGIVEAARHAVPDDEIEGWTNHDGPATIEGSDDNIAAIPGLLAMLPEVRKFDADAVVIACFDDTGLQDIRAHLACPVLGIGQASYHVAALCGARFSVLTSVEAAIPVLKGNIRSYGLDGYCLGVFASGIDPAEIDIGSPATIEALTSQIRRHYENGAERVVLGCSGMARHKRSLQAASVRPLIEGVSAATRLARAIA